MCKRVWRGDKLQMSHLQNKAFLYVHTLARSVLKHYFILWKIIAVSEQLNVIFTKADIKLSIYAYISNLGLFKWFFSLSVSFVTLHEERVLWRGGGGDMNAIARDEQILMKNSDIVQIFS